MQLRISVGKGHILLKQSVNLKYPYASFSSNWKAQKTFNQWEKSTDPSQKFLNYAYLFI